MNLNDLKNFFGLHEKSLVPNVGIGTTSPSSMLDIEVTTAGNPTLLNLSNQTAVSWGAGSKLKFEGAGNVEMANIQGLWDSASSTYLLQEVRKSNAMVNVFRAWEGGPFNHPELAIGGYPAGGNPSSAARVRVLTESTSGNSVANGLALHHVDSDGGASNGIGNMITFWEETTTNGTHAESASIVSALSDAVNTSKDGYLSFATLGPDAGSGTTAATEKMRINSAGNVGIGTTTPYNKLVVLESSNSGSSVSIATPGTQGSQQAYVTLMTKDNNASVGAAGTKGWQVLGRGDAWSTTSQQNDLMFSYYDGSTWKDPMLMDSITGNIGIGTNNPASKLHVNGRISTTVGTDADALSALTVDFSNSNFIRATAAAAACGTLNVTNTTPGASYTVTIPLATANCTTIQWNSSGTNVKLPAGYTGGTSVSGVVYTFLDDGAYLWVSEVQF